MHGLLLMPSLTGTSAPLVGPDVTPRRFHQPGRGGHISYEWSLGSDIDENGKRCRLVARLRCGSWHPAGNVYTATLSRVRRYHGHLDRVLGVGTGPAFGARLEARHWDATTHDAFARASLDALRERAGVEVVRAVFRVTGPAEVTEVAVPNLTSAEIVAWLEKLCGGPVRFVHLDGAVALACGEPSGGPEGVARRPRNDVAMGVIYDILASGDGCSVEVYGPAVVVGAAMTCGCGEEIGPEVAGALVARVSTVNEWFASGMVDVHTGSTGACGPDAGDVHVVH